MAGAVSSRENKTHLEARPNGVRVLFQLFYYCKCVFHLFGQNSLGSMMSK